MHSPNQTWVKIYIVLYEHLCKKMSLISLYYKFTNILYIKKLLLQLKREKKIHMSRYDRAENDSKSRIWLFFSPFLFPPKKRGKIKMRMKCLNRDFMSCLSARSQVSDLIKIISVRNPLKIALINLQHVCVNSNSIFN